MTAFTPTQLNPSTLLPLIKALYTNLTKTLRYALIYALLISTTIMIQNSSYFFTPLALHVLGFTSNIATANLLSALQHEGLSINHITTTIVAVHWSLLLTLALWTAARFGIGVKVDMGAVEMGWYGGRKEEE